MRNSYEKERLAEKNDYDGLQSKFLETRTLLLSGDIDKELAERLIRNILLLEAEGDIPIKVFIDSPGGDADAGYAIFDMLRFVKPEIITVGMGTVASAAALVHLAANKENRLSLPNAHFLIHQPLSGMRGVATEIEIHARELERLREKINVLIARETGQSLEKVAGDTDRDYWLNAEEALEYGLITRIIKSRSELA
ncbi:ATP-dependent Clp protease proteolytic subunit [Olavius algarvensis spirochete endosymbiont]|uniref:ATP-dependent Clp protease proteolytic subunit n=1 Tax=Olavius algarvensis spirochete endosymbiont TaxID=260710 RepID=UPI000F12E0C6|nr:ATP-dependent Clp protease proteolytic subunit [Olavius algarvensis spirochete endosymbiont]VDA99497.1 ATP-dependent Clp protease proteolytic subunit [Olavius algarvensis spirochete endosymbiont]